MSVSGAPATAGRRGRAAGLAARARRALGLAAKGWAVLTADDLSGVPVRDRVLIARETARARSGRAPVAAAAFARLEQDRSPATLALACVHARAALHAKRYADARIRADHILTVSPDHPEALRLRAQALRDLGHLGEALETVRRARAVRDHAEAATLEAGIDGLLRSLDGTWLPDLGTGSSLDPVPGRVLHLLDRSLPHTLSGYTIRSLEIVRSQRGIGLDAIAATRLGVPIVSGADVFPLVEEVEGVPHHRLIDQDIQNYNALPRDRYLQRYAELAAALVERLRPAVIHAAATHANGLVGLALRARYGIPLVYEVRNFYEDIWAAKHDAPPGTDLHAARARAETQCMLGADRVVTLSEGMRARIIERGVAPDRVIVVGNAVDAERFTPRAPAPGARAAFGLPATATVLGYISGLRKYEGVDVLLRAIALLREQGRDVAGLIAGDGDELEPLRALARDLGIDDIVRLPGAVPHERIVDTYPLIDLFVVPRTLDPVAQEVTPLKPFEALAMERPLLVSDLPPLREVIGADERGLAFRPEDPADLAAQAALLLDDPALRERLATAGAAWVRAERSWRANAERYRALYDELTR